MRRVVIDTSVMVAALRSRRGASSALLRAVARREIAALATTALFLEYEDVLKRDEHLRAAGLHEEDVDRFLGALASLATPVEVRVRWRPQLRDANDELVLEAAINGRADMLVTFNERDFAGVAPRFGIRVVRPAIILQEL